MRKQHPNLLQIHFLSKDLDSWNTQDKKPSHSPSNGLCRELENQGDANSKYLKVIVTGASQYRLLKGIFYNTNYLAPVAGTMTINANNTRRISLQGTYVDVDENLHIVILDATVDSKTKNGTVYVRKDEEVTYSYDLTRIPCRTLPELPASQE